MHWFDLTLDLFLPDSCPACGRPPARTLPLPLCELCAQELWRFPRPLQPQLGQRTAWCLGTYRGPLGRCLLRAKTRGLSGQLSAMGELVGRQLHRRVPRVDTVVPVPSSRRRGIDSSHLLAREAARCLGVPMRRLLHRINWSGQRGQSVHGRRRQAARSYRASATPADGLPLPRRVLLLDDVKTTGATLEACTQELLGAGVEVVHAVAVVAALRECETTASWSPTQGQSSLSVPGEP